MVLKQQSLDIISSFFRELLRAWDLAVHEVSQSECPPSNGISSSQTLLSVPSILIFVWVHHLHPQSGHMVLDGWPFAGSWHGRVTRA